jgi:hypothetical protein
MRLSALAAFGLLLAQPAFADSIDTASIVSAVTGDFNKDGEKDLALLLRGEDEMDLHLLLGVTGRGYLAPTETIKGKVWGNAEPGGFVGQEPYLVELPNGSLAVHTRNDAIGRNRWEQTLTLAVRKEALIVAGFSYQWRDTLEPDNAGWCDINILTGKGFRETYANEGDPVKSPLAIAAQQTPFSTWSDEKVISACNPE